MIARLTEKIWIVEGGKNGRYPYAHSLYIADGDGILVDAGSDPADTPPQEPFPPLPRFQQNEARPHLLRPPVAHDADDPHRGAAPGGPGVPAHLRHRPGGRARHHHGIPFLRGEGFRPLLRLAGKAEREQQDLLHKNIISRM